MFTPERSVSGRNLARNTSTRPHSAASRLPSRLSNRLHVRRSVYCDFCRIPGFVNASILESRNSSMQPQSIVGVTSIITSIQPAGRDRSNGGE